MPVGGGTLDEITHFRLFPLKAAAVPFRTTFQYGSAWAVESREGVGGDAVACNKSSRMLMSIVAVLFP